MTGVVYTRTFNGTTPDNSSDNLLFTIDTARKILGFYGTVTILGDNRVVNVESLHSGNNAHGPMYQFYGNELHVYNATGDTRWQNNPYCITVEYLETLK